MFVYVYHNKASREEMCIDTFHDFSLCYCWVCREQYTDLVRFASQRANSEILK